MKNLKKKNVKRLKSLNLKTMLKVLLMKISKSYNNNANIFSALCKNDYFGPIFLFM